MKNQKQIKNVSYSEGNEFQKLVMLIIIVAVIAAVFYGISIFVSKDRDKLKYQETPKSSQIEYDQILISDTFNKENEYYVLYTKEKNVFMTLYNSYITTYKAKEGAIPLYKADLSDSLNQKYIGTENKFERENFTIATECLLKVQEGSVVESYIGNETIVTKLYELSKTSSNS